MGTYTFSEHGEDILIHRLLFWKTKGTYLNVGAYHPLKMSMTARLKLYGWHGINIDICDSVKEKFDEYFADDINLTSSIGVDGVKYTFYSYEDPVINTEPVNW